uniref:IlGF domain-containing protein n=1 Tax=Strongyloides papillosus TaxID=174720 RepID=A0A0N5BBG9_STREA
MLTTVCRSHNCAKDTEYDIHGGLEKRSIGNEGVVYGERENLNRGNMYDQQPIKRSGGVVNDCCINRCTLEHLKTYCCGYADEEVDF